MYLSSQSFSKQFILVVSLFLFTGCATLNPRAKADYTDKTADMDFAFVQGGAYQMGSSERADAQPVHTVTIPDLFVGMYEVTFKQYDRFCAATGYKRPDDSGWGRGDRPVINVTWDDANAYAAWLSEQTERKFRLPSESEWEYFARAGTITRFWTGDTLPKESANCKGCGSQWDDKMTAQVGSFPPNKWRIYDTDGNVTEWALDPPLRNYKDVPDDGSPVRAEGVDRRIQRGGGWNYPASDLMSFARDYRWKDKATNDAGFRLVLLPKEEPPPAVVK